MRREFLDTHHDFAKPMHSCPLDMGVQGIVDAKLDRSSLIAVSHEKSPGVASLGFVDSRILRVRNYFAAAFSSLILSVFSHVNPSPVRPK